MEFTNIDIKKGADTLKGMAKNANETALKTSDKLVEGSLEAAGKWQKVAEKALKTGTVLFGKQQDLMFTVLEGVKTQGMMGTMRLKNLFSVDMPKSVKPTTAIKKKEVAEVAKVTKKAVAKVEKKAKTVAKKTVTKAAKEVAKTAATVEKKAKTVAKVAAPKKTTKTSISAKKTVTKATAKASTKKDDLKAINGIGPKMETFLNKIGIVSYADLAKANVTELKATLIAENARYKMFDPADWVKEATAKK